MNIAQMVTPILATALLVAGLWFFVWRKPTKPLADRVVARLHRFAFRAQAFATAAEHAVKVHRDTMAAIRHANRNLYSDEAEG